MPMHHLGSPVRAWRRGMGIEWRLGYESRGMRLYREYKQQHPLRPDQTNGTNCNVDFTADETPQQDLIIVKHKRTNIVLAVGIILALLAILTLRRKPN